MRENAINILVDSLLDNYQVKISQYSIKMNGHFSFCVVDGVGEPGTLDQSVHSRDNFLLLVSTLLSEPIAKLDTSKRTKWFLSIGQHTLE